MGSCKVLAVFLAVLATCNVGSGQVILEVPGYAVLNGTEELSTYTERPFFAFRSVFYADKPTSENRFLVRRLFDIIPFRILIVVLNEAALAEAALCHG